MKNQISFNLNNIKKEKVISNYQKQKWRNALQKYCDEMSDKIGPTTGYCVCGYMQFCDFCKDVADKNSCVKSICELAKIKNIKINYLDYDFEKFIDKVDKQI